MAAKTYRLGVDVGGTHTDLVLLDVAGGTLREDPFEQNALMRHVLIDDPEPVAAGGDDETVVNLANGPKIRENGERCDF